MSYMEGAARTRLDGSLESGTDTAFGGPRDDNLYFQDESPGDKLDGGAHETEDECSFDEGDTHKNCENLT